MHLLGKGKEGSRQLALLLFPQAAHFLKYALQGPSLRMHNPCASCLSPVDSILRVRFDGFAAMHITGARWITAELRQCCLPLGRLASRFRSRRLPLRWMAAANRQARIGKKRTSQRLHCRLFDSTSVDVVTVGRASGRV